jgi:hypothetical protein
MSNFMLETLEYYQQANEKLSLTRLKLIRFEQEKILDIPLYVHAREIKSLRLRRNRGDFKIISCYVIWTPCYATETLCSRVTFLFQASKYLFRL